MSDPHNEHPERAVVPVEEKHKESRTMVGIVMALTCSPNRNVTPSSRSIHCGTVQSACRGSTLISTGLHSAPSNP